MKVWFWNKEGRSERLSCDCGSDDWKIHIEDCEGTVFMCLKCEEPTRYFQQFRTEGR